jgi:hypothetical protein
LEKNNSKFTALCLPPPDVSKVIDRQDGLPDPITVEMALVVGIDLKWKRVPAEADTTGDRYFQSI